MTETHEFQSQWAAALVRNARVVRYVSSNVPLATLVRLTRYSLDELVNEIIPAVCSEGGHTYSVRIG